MEKNQYYSKYLSAERLKRCYDIAPPRTRQYLEAEIQHAVNFISPNDKVIELGCGYGRLLPRILEVCEFVTGIDTSFDNLRMAKRTLCSDVHLLQMNASTLGFKDNQFDTLLCLQNGISAFKLDPIELIRESIRVTRPGGVCLFSSYSDNFWEARLEWFEIQSSEGLLGEIDWSKTKDGIIVCKDGFHATTFRISDFSDLVNKLRVKAQISEIDESSIFCEIHIED
ncbi:MAG: class I SAM-dependent methyltransferase [Candidatus Thorarchaeota archaeon]|jgi:2-polyprenyl-6-hydroxyphenyl methylase/3-demethylubiquinone-9 3-methyltransferase